MLFQSHRSVEGSVGPRFEFLWKGSSGAPRPVPRKQAGQAPGLVRAPLTPDSRSPPNSSILITPLTPTSGQPALRDGKCCAWLGGGAVPVLGENEGRGVPWLYVCSWGHLCCADPGSTEKHVEFRADAAGSCFLKKIEWHSFLSWCCFRGCRGRFSCYWSLQVVRRGHRPAAHCGWGAPAEPPFRLRRGLHAGAPGHPLPAAGHARHPAHGGEFSRDALYGGNVFFCFFLLCVLFFFFFMWQCFSNSSYNVSLNSSEMFQILLSPLKSYIKLET